MCGIGAKEFKILCGNPFNGGLGLAPQVVMDLTLDQIILLLCDDKHLPTSGITKTKNINDIPASDGMIKVRGEDGKLYKMPIEEFYRKEQ